MFCSGDLFVQFRAKGAFKGSLINTLSILYDQINALAIARSWLVAHPLEKKLAFEVERIFRVQDYA